jgi:hypothetical protein
VRFDNLIGTPKEGAMKTTLVRSDFDLENPPRLSAAEQVQLARLAEMQDEDVGTSDIPR